MEGKGRESNSKVEGKKMLQGKGNQGRGLDREGKRRGRKGREGKFTVVRMKRK